MGIVFFVVTLLLFASMEVFSKPLMGEINPLVLTFWRFVCGIAVLGIAMILRKKRVNLKPKSIFLLAIMGILNTFISMSLLQVAVELDSAARAATLFCSNPVFVVIIASALGWEKFSKKKAMGLLLGISGLALVTGLHSFSIHSGTLYALLSSLSFALYILVSRKASMNIDPISVNVISFAFGIVALAIWLIAKGISISPAPLSASIPSFLYLGIGVSGIGYVTFITTIKKLGAGKASTIFLLKPAVATILAILILNESLTLYFVIGLFLTGLGSYLIAQKK